MAIYADIDKFIQNLKTNEYGETTMTKIAIALRNARVDVVPKSEEGAECPTCHGTGRIGTTDWLTKNISKKQLAEEKAKAIAEHEQHIKTEVAREIFEEIENRSFGFGACFVEMTRTTFYELKKKYTEEQK